MKIKLMCIYTNKNNINNFIIIIIIKHLRYFICAVYTTSMHSFCNYKNEESFHSLTSKIISQVTLILAHCVKLTVHMAHWNLSVTVDFILLTVCAYFARKTLKG